jgi:hypothetical protein
MATDPRPCPISPCDWDLEGTLGGHLFTQHDEEELSAALVRALLETDRLHAAVHAVQALCAEYSAAEVRGLAPRGSHFVYWVRTAVSEFAPAVEG